ncbi:type II inositol-1,4,5-trisphosphate 5-phosphatase [Phlyctema vagabunda]|uniref:Type II inositol-1,4,5-trisphosphate 5-phosphatase n=1 Tax=Phlyctema vagabunda TaxID=108571 RepID=A0ABR4P8E9_9HELO
MSSVPSTPAHVEDDVVDLNFKSTPHSLSKAVFARRAEYTRPQKIKVKVGTWNVAACPGTEKDLGGWFVDGKGIDQKLAGLRVADGIDSDKSQDQVETTEQQEARRTKKESTIPRGDKGTIVGGDEIGLYVLGLQEVVELTSAKEYIGRVYTDNGPATKWRKTLMDALPTGYELVAEQQLSGLLLFIFASPTVAPTVSSISTASVGTGIMGYLGNKGAVITRIVLGETTRMVFVNSHLASGTDAAHLDRRYWDVNQILTRTHFDPISWAGVLDDNSEVIGDEDFAFWFGDLNFRLDGLPGDDIRRLLMLHTKGEYKIETGPRKSIDAELDDAGSEIIIHHVDSEDDSDTEFTPPSFKKSDQEQDSGSSTALPDPEDFVQNPHADPASLQATLDSLLPHDQLLQAQKSRKAFHDGWREGPITFLPTYKYDVGSMGMFDSSEKKRAPSWCDRILFRTRRDKMEYEGKSQEEALARIKDEEMKARGIDHAGDDEDVLFDYDPDTDGVDETPPPGDYDEYDDDLNEVQPEEVITKEGFVDRLHLDVYTSHQRVLSSDHKPLDAVFTLEYDAVVPELKSRIQAEVAKELDRAENEGRPGITIVVDHSQAADEIVEVQSNPRKTDTTLGDEGIEFGEVGFQRRKIRYLTIANTGQVQAKFAFVNRPSPLGVDRISPEWLTVKFLGHDPEDGPQDVDREIVLEPGDAINVSMEILVSEIPLVRALNLSQTFLEDVLVLRVIDGRDHFIPVRGYWLQSCFGRSVEELIRIPEGGVRALLPDSSGHYVNRGQEVRWSAPRELFKLTETIESLVERVIAEESMLDCEHPPREAAGWPFDKAGWIFTEKNSREVRKSEVIIGLESDKNLNECLPAEIPAVKRLEIVAEVLLMFLDSITDGIVPESLWLNLDEQRSLRDPRVIMDAEEEKSQILDVLSASPNHNISFVFLTSMLAKLASELAPVSNSYAASIASSARSSIDQVRRSLSFRGKPPPLPSDPAIVRRQAVDRRYAEIFAPVIFKISKLLKEKERKAMEDRRRDILEVFLRGREYD